MSLTQETPKWKKALRLTLYCLFAAAVLAAGSFAAWISQSKVLTKLVIDKGKDVLHIPHSNPFVGQDSVTLLVLGCDEDRYFGGEQIIRHQARSDMMLLCKLDFRNNRITGLSIPRDTLVASNGHASQKINAYHVMHAGYQVEQNNEESKTAVETLLPEVHIDRVMALDFGAFDKMVDIAGGVDINVPKNMNYDDNRGHLHIHLQKGLQHLDGEQSEEFVRFRHADDDFHRVARQQDFVLSLKKAVFSHISALPQVTNEAVALTGKALTEDEIAAIAEFVQKVGEKNIQMGTIPVLDSDDGHWDLMLDDSRAPAILKKYHFIEDDLEADKLPDPTTDTSKS
jgi:polyisoprenyl-teichoic acid--peptidoglycan teichoic acid transferase